MRTKPCYLVINTESRRVRTVRQSWPSLEPSEVVLKVAFEIPDDRLPQLEEFTLEVDDDAMRVAVLPEPLSDEA